MIKQDEGVVELAEVLQRGDQAADLGVGVFAEGGEHFHLTREQPLFVGAQRLPVLDRRGFRSKFSIGRHDAKLLLALQSLLTQLIPAIANLSARQGMAGLQPAAHKKVKLHAKANFLHGTRILPANPYEAAKAYRRIAESERAKLAPLRQALLKARTRNLERAGPAAFTEQMLSSNGKRAMRSLHPAATRKPNPRQTVLPGILEGRDNRSRSNSGSCA